jgi:glycosyltransferase involved in cell wall biosynthesis
MSVPGKIHASVYIITLNEEKNLPRALQSVQAFDEIVVVDSGSTDRTLEVAKQVTPRVYTHEWQGFSKQKEYAKSLCTHDWVFNLDADEEADELLLKEMAQAVSENQVDALNIRISEFFMGRFGHPRARHNAKVRFFRKSKGCYSGSLVHEGVVVRGHTETARGFIRHYGEVSLAVKVDKNNRYSTLRAQEKLLKNKKPSVLKLVFVLPATFLKSFFLRRNFLNGRRGFVGSMINAFYAFLKEAKLYENTVTKD